MPSKLQVAILFGGKSGEHEVSIVSALSVYKALDKSRYDVSLIGIDKTGRWLLPEQSAILAQQDNPRLIALNEIKDTVGLLPFPADVQFIPVPSPQQHAPHTQALSQLGKIDVVLPILHGTNGEDGTVQGLLELAGIPYVGSGVLGSAIGMDKDMAKRVLHEAGIPVVPSRTLRKSQFEKDKNAIRKEIEERFSYPYFVKPANMGSSVGVGKVKEASEALKKIEAAFLYDTKILIEEGIPARELEVSVLGNEEPKASIVGEIVPQHEFYSYEAKYIDEDGALLKIPAEGLTKEQIHNIQDIAVRAFLALELSGLARVDFFLDKENGKLYVNEVNTIPGFTQISMYPKLWEASGLPYGKLLDRLIELALEKHAVKKALLTSFRPEGEK